MAFRFTLHALLRFRQSVERQQQLLLQEANHQVALVRREIEVLDGHLGAIAAHDAGELENGVRAAELQFQLLCRAILLGHRRQLETTLAQREEVRISRSQAFHEARRQREAVETLRQLQWQAYQQGQKRKEQRYLDELFLLRRAFLRRG
jgi:flagellar export protein FliJ